jgi:hypothetical protein
MYSPKKVEIKSVISTTKATSDNQEENQMNHYQASFPFLIKSLVHHNQPQRTYVQEVTIEWKNIHRDTRKKKK